LLWNTILAAFYFLSNPFLTIAKFILISYLFGACALPPRCIIYPFLLIFSEPTFQAYAPSSSICSKAWFEFRFVWKVANPSGTLICVKSICAKAVSSPHPCFPRGKPFVILGLEYKNKRRFSIIQHNYTIYTTYSVSRKDRINA